MSFSHYNACHFCAQLKSRIELLEYLVIFIIFGSESKAAQIKQ